MNQCPPRRISCEPKSSNTSDLKSLVAQYRRDHAPNSAAENEMFHNMPSMELAIHHVALAIDDNDRCFDHQFRIIQPARRKAKTILSQAAARLKACKSFHELHSLLIEILSPVQGLGEMYIYDAAVRLGAYLNLSPKRVYLHRGTRDGARALGLNVTRPYLDVYELPASLQVLSADDLESFLCIFKDRLSPP